MIQLVALLGSFGLGVCFSLLGAISVKLMPRLTIDRAKFGTLVTAFMSSCLVASLVLGVVTDKVGYGPVAMFGFVLAACCVLLLARGRSYATVFISCVLFGWGAMAINTAANTLIPVVFFEGKNPAAASNLGNVAFGIGLLLAPLLLSYLFQKMSYENAVSLAALLVLVPVVPAALATYPRSDAAVEFSVALGMLAEPAVLLAAAALFCYAALDVSFSNWLPAFGKETLAASRPDAATDAVDASAQRLISVYAVSLILGRLAASQVPSLTEYGGWFIGGASLVVALLVAWMAWTRSAAAAWLLVFVVGLLTAPFFPTIVGITFAKYRPEVYGSVFGLIFAGALLGGATVPKAIGNLSQGSSVQRSMMLLVPLCLVLAALVLALGML